MATYARRVAIHGEFGVIKHVHAELAEAMVRDGRARQAGRGRVVCALVLVEGYRAERPFIPPRIHFDRKRFTSHSSADTNSARGTVRRVWMQGGGFHETA